MTSFGERIINSLLIETWINNQIQIEDAHKLLDSTAAVLLIQIEAAVLLIRIEDVACCQHSAANLN